MMKYVFAAVAVVAAIVALYIRPPQFAAGVVPADGTPPPVTRIDRSGLRPAHGTPAAVSPVVVIYVAGAVRKPGVYRLASTDRAVDALARAGGAGPDADLVAVNLAAPLTDGAEIAVPKLGERPLRVSPGRIAHAKRARSPHHRVPRHSTQAAGASPSASIDLNNATPDLLEDVPGVGPGLAARIVAYRELNGPFSTVDELADVAGITPRLQDALAAAVVIR